MPNSAKCRTALNAKQREMPYCAKPRVLPNTVTDNLASHLARRPAFCVVWHSASSGIPRRSAFCAVEASRRSALRVVQPFAPFSLPGFRPNRPD
jgi:hypothetical protein